LAIAPKEVRDITFAMMGPSGEIIPAFRIQMSPLTPEDFVTLSPGETIEKTLNIQRIYHPTDIGLYSLSAVYQNVMDPGLFSKKAWKGEITSNEVTFEITP
jgi:hypothetical protein